MVGAGGWFFFVLKGVWRGFLLLRVVFRCPLWGVFGRFRFAVSLVSVSFSGFRSVSVWFFVGFGCGFGRFFVFSVVVSVAFFVFSVVVSVAFSWLRLVLVFSWLMVFRCFGWFWVVFRVFGWFWSSFSLVLVAVSVGFGRLFHWFQSASPSVSVVFFVGFVVGFGRLFR